MHDDRQIVLLGQFQLRSVKKLLPRHVQAGHKSVQTYFTHGHQARVSSVLLQGDIQCLQVGLTGLRRVQRMDTQGVNVAMLVGELAHNVKVCDLHRWDNAYIYPR
jgi:hypothetical protein